MFQELDAATRAASGARERFFEDQIQAARCPLLPAARCRVYTLLEPRFRFEASAEAGEARHRQLLREIECEAARQEAAEASQLAPSHPA